MPDRDLVYSCTIYEKARYGYAVPQCHLMSVLWFGGGGGGEVVGFRWKSGNVGKSQTVEKSTFQRQLRI